MKMRHEMEIKTMCIKFNNNHHDILILPSIFFLNFLYHYMGVTLQYKAKKNVQVKLFHYYKVYCKDFKPSQLTL